MRQYFVTGTDTDVGKTVVSQLLLRHFNQQGLKTIGFKPIAAGCERKNGKLTNHDALVLKNNSSMTLSYDEVNPYAFEPPIAPHIAAASAGHAITFSGLTTGLMHLRQKQPDVLLVEGAGGWYLPISDSQYLCDWVAEQRLEVILVVGIKLGCLNHALLTANSIKNQGLKLAGWVANIVIPDTLNITQNIATLENAIAAPLLATVPYSRDHIDQLSVSFSQI